MPAARSYGARKLASARVFLEGIHYDAIGLGRASPYGRLRYPLVGLQAPQRVT